MNNLKPRKQFLEVVNALVEQKKEAVRVAEIGVGVGATTKAVLDLLRPKDVFDVYDFMDKEFFAEAPALVPAGVTLNICGNSRKLHDSYAWTLANKCMERLKEQAPLELYDAVYLDGSHTFAIEAPTVYLIKQMIKQGGFLIMDDMDWTLSGSPTCNTEEMRAMYTAEQMTTKQVSLVADLFLRVDNNFLELSPPTASVSIFRKKAVLDPSLINKLTAAKEHHNLLLRQLFRAQEQTRYWQLKAESAAIPSNREMSHPRDLQDPTPSRSRPPLIDQIYMLMGAGKNILRTLLRYAGWGKYQQRLLRKSGLFDSDWYLSNYPDVRDSKFTAAEHYLVFGGFEGRDPSPSFSSSAYIIENPDVAQSKVNPLLHYVNYGRKEGRRIRSSATDVT